MEGKIKGEVEVTRRHKKLLDDLKDRRGYSHLKEEALDLTMWRNRFGGGFKPVGARGGVVVKALRYKPAGRGFDSRWCHWNFSVT